ncbi:hypothetical protein BDR03DRAFT_987376 [Suillus americanus]|nr:hypothetical protein BDR03DRAFT_987376 [Suillus americanus]
MPALDANKPDANEHNTNRFQAILRSLDGTSSGGQKQKHSDVLDPYLSSACFFCLNYDLFTHFNMVLWEGMQAQFDPDWIDPEQDQSKEAQATREHHLQVYQNFSSSIPNWNELVKNFETEAESLNEFLRAMENAANSARCNDTGSLKHNGLQYLLKDPAKDHFNPPILKTHGKAVWGWNHTATARLLCPARDILKFNKDSHAYMDQVKSGQKKITSKQWPSMFYDMSLYNPRNKKLGFLHGHAIVQMYFVACNGESWTPEVGTMNLDDLYYTAVDLLEMHADEQWVKNLLQFWKDKMPGLMQGHPSKRWRIAANSTASDSEDDMDDFFSSDSEETQGGSRRNRSTMDHESHVPAGSINDPTSTMQRESDTGNTTGPSSTGGATAAAAESDSTRSTAAAGSSSTDGAGQG